MMKSLHTLNVLNAYFEKSWTTRQEFLFWEKGENSLLISLTTVYGNFVLISTDLLARRLGTFVLSPIFSHIIITLMLFNPFPAKLSYLNFHPVEVVSSSFEDRHWSILVFKHTFRSQ